MTLPDLSALTLVQLVSVFIFFTAIDTGFAWITAAANGTFDAAYALDFLRSHIATKGAPILGMAIIGAGIPQLGIPSIPVAFAAAVAALGVYILQVIASVRGTAADKAVVPA